jgi:hypothetical protein
MSITLTFFKKLGSKECDDFRGSFAGPGEPPGEWEYLGRYRDIKDSGIKLSVNEFSDLNSLIISGVNYSTRIKQYPYLELTYNGDTSKAIPYSPSISQNDWTSNQIRKWVFESIKVLAPKGQPSQDQTISDQTTNDALDQTENNASDSNDQPYMDEPEEIPENTNQQSDRETTTAKVTNNKEALLKESQIVDGQSPGIINEFKNDPWFSYILGGSLLLVMCTVAGVIIGSKLSDDSDIEVYRKKNNKAKLIFEEKEKLRHLLGGKAIYPGNQNGIGNQQEWTAVDGLRMPTPSNNIVASNNANVEQETDYLFSEDDPDDLTLSFNGAPMDFGKKLRDFSNMWEQGPPSAFKRLVNTLVGKPKAKETATKSLETNTPITTSVINTNKAAVTKDVNNYSSSEPETITDGVTVTFSDDNDADDIFMGIADIEETEEVQNNKVTE